ncbi:MAG: cobalamin-binding protein [Bacillati bacterium ANGP1]|uniref:Cobalamin-binding protein n=1 Tax=Candidatus Segetimicrobium genomatis TaxID=2569760 RepID=A0A537JTD6_9BACT|nr:MAG: cobalamin-binding protein [Terrabacteria group bacterium ANGP1]
MRIVSLLPSATEILCALGLADQVVGISHACDYPARITNRPRLTRSVLREDLASGEIHRRVQESAAGRARLYELDGDLLARLQPDLIVTQDQCSVCAVGKSDVDDAVTFNGCDARVVVLRATRFREVMDDILMVGSATGREEAAGALTARMRVRLEDVRRGIAQARRPRVLCLSWFDPLMAASHWMTDIVECAGGVDDLGAGNRGSTPLEPGRLVSYDPETIVLMPCDFGLERTMREWRKPAVQGLCGGLNAVRNGRVYAVKGSLFHRPGPRLVDGVELLAGVLHPLRVRHDHSREAIRTVA